MSTPEPALPDTLPEALLDGIQYTDPAELAHAQATIDDLLAQLKEERIPLTRPLKRVIRTTAQICLIALRATNATLGRDDGKANPAAAYSAASTALDRQQKALDDFDALVARERALLTPADLPATPEDEAKAQEEKSIKNINNLQIPIQGLAVQKQPQRLKLLADALHALDKANQQYLESNQPAPYRLPSVPESLLPAPKPSQQPESAVDPVPSPKVPAPDTKPNHSPGSTSPQRQQPAPSAQAAPTKRPVYAARYPRAASSASAAPQPARKTMPPTGNDPAGTTET